MTVENVQSLGIADMDRRLGQMVLPSGINGPTIGVPGLDQGSRRGAGTYGTTGRLRRVQGFVCPTTGATAPSWYQLCRLSSDALVLSVEAILASGTITTFAGDVTLGFSDAAADGTQYQYQVAGPPSGLSAAPANALILNPGNTATGLSGANAFFAPAFAFGGLTARVWTDVTLGSAAGVGVFGSSLVYAAGKGVELPFIQPLWQLVGFTQDPKGNFDVGILTTATNSVANAIVGLRVTYLDYTGG